MSDYKCRNPDCNYMTGGLEVCTKCGKSQSYMALESERDSLKAQLEKFQRPLDPVHIDDSHPCVPCFEKLVKREAELRAELAKFKENADKAICSYCGHIGPKKHYFILRHLLKCKKHPWTRALDGKVAAEKDRDRWREMAEKLAEESKQGMSSLLTIVRWMGQEERYKKLKAADLVWLEGTRNRLIAWETALTAFAALAGQTEKKHEL